eukprot:GHVS01045558.1.p1 GENE.GHVS01045558.1~~GHVS01045558.1.p1  ORF type:complete len:222 (-),score=41.13 GHVS01045558.1:93-758(-)
MCHYRVLGIARDASKLAVRKAYLVKAKKHHPDVSTSTTSDSSLFKQVQAAYSVLSDEQQRQDYDRQLGYAPHHPSSSPPRAARSGWVDDSTDPEFAAGMREQAERLRRDREGMRSAFERQRRRMENGYPNGPDFTSWSTSYGGSSFSSPSLLLAFLRTIPFFFLPFLLFSIISSSRSETDKDKSQRRIPVYHDNFGRAFIVDSFGRKHRVTDLDLPPATPH